MATRAVHSLEGSTSAQAGGLVSEATTDNGIAITFDVETPGEYIGAGIWGICQRLYIEGQTDGQALTVELLTDSAAAISLGTITLGAGVKRVMEVACLRAGWILGVRLSAASLTTRIEISAVEMDVYVP